METKNATDWFIDGYNYGEKGEYQKAIKCFDKSIELAPNNAIAYYNKGLALYNLGKHQEAIDCYDIAIKLDPFDADAYNNKGIALRNLGKYQEAIDCYDIAIKLNPDYAKAYCNKGVALDNLGNYEEAIKYYDKSIKLKGADNAITYNNKGGLLYYLGEYQKALECYEKAIEINPDFTLAQANREEVLKILEDEDNKYLSSDYSEHNKLFDEVTEKLSEEPKKHCRKIFNLSLKTLDILQIQTGDIHETNVAHYTSKKVSQILFFDKEKDKNGEEIKDEKGKTIPIPFRLNSVTNSNDIQEGKTLFNYLFENQKIRPQNEQYVAFVGCFMFNYDNLNQFRLYGKEKDKEGTGISIVFNGRFFSLVPKSPVKSEGRQISDDGNKEPLFRCIYIDPDTNQVVSIGHRDFYTFYKTKEILYNSKNKLDKIPEIEQQILDYKKKINDKIELVKGVFEELKIAINAAREQNIDDRVICDLLLNLRYLVKHVAFKEEQECRIIKIKRPCETDNEPPKDEDNKHERFYVDYLPLTDCVKKIYFGPKATGMELFQSLLTYQSGFKNVICHRSTSPLA